MLQGLLPFDKGHFGPDVIAGITLAALGIPEVMGYTKIIGTPVITGLYTGPPRTTRWPTASISEIENRARSLPSVNVLNKRLTAWSRAED
jgi:hypothetical protein